MSTKTDATFREAFEDVMPESWPDIGKIFAFIEIVEDEMDIEDTVEENVEKKTDEISDKEKEE